MRRGGGGGHRGEEGGEGEGGEGEAERGPRRRRERLLRAPWRVTARHGASRRDSCGRHGASRRVTARHGASRRARPCGADRGGIQAGSCLAACAVRKGVDWWFAGWLVSIGGCGQAAPLAVAAIAVAATAARSKLPSQRLQLQRVRRAGPGRDGCLHDLGGAVVGGVEGGDGHDDGARLPQRRGDGLWQGVGLCAVVLRSHPPGGCRGPGKVGDAECPVPRSAKRRCHGRHSCESKMCGRYARAAY